MLKGGGFHTFAVADPKDSRAMRVVKALLDVQGDSGTWQALQGCGASKKK